MTLFDGSDYEIPPEMMGEHPPIDRYMRYEDDFNACIAERVDRGEISQDLGDIAMTDFHVFLTGNRFAKPDAQTSPRFFE